jgi:HK97 gp10 family phage protein
MVTITVKIHGLEELEKGAKKMPEKTASEISKAVQKSIAVIHNQALKEAPTGRFQHHGKGSMLRLRQRINSRMTGNMKGEVVSDAPYSAYVHEGTRPHVIEAKNARVLATESKYAPNWPRVSKGGYAIFGKRVQHTGTRPNPFLKRAVEKRIRDVENFFGEALQNTINLLK